MWTNYVCVCVCVCVCICRNINADTCKHMQRACWVCRTQEGYYTTCSASAAPQVIITKLTVPLVATLADCGCNRNHMTPTENRCMIKDWGAWRRLFSFFLFLSLSLSLSVSLSSHTCSIQCLHIKIMCRGQRPFIAVSFYGIVIHAQ